MSGKTHGRSMEFKSFGKGFYMPNETVGNVRTDLPGYLVRKRTVNKDGTVTLSRAEYVIVQKVMAPQGYPLFFGMRVNTEESDKIMPVGAVLGNIELLVDGYQL